MNSVLQTNAIRPDVALTEDPGWVIAQAAQAESTIFTEEGNHRIALFQGSLLPRYVNLNDPNLTLGKDQYDFEVLNFTFNRPGNLQDCNSIEIKRIIIYGIPEVDGSREKLSSAEDVLAANSISDVYATRRKRYLAKSNTLHFKVNGAPHSIEIFPYQSVHWLTIEELFDHFKTRFHTYLLTLDPAAIVDLRITDGYIDLVWQSLILNIEINASDSFPYNNIFSLLHDVIYIHSFTGGVVDLSIGMTDGFSLKMYPTREALSDNASLLGGNIVLFSSAELTQFMTNDNIVAGGSTNCCAVGVLDQRGFDVKVIEKQGVWDFSTEGRSNLVSNKMVFDSTKIQDTFQIGLSIATRIDVNGAILEFFEITINKYLPHHKIRMLMFANVY